MKREICAAEKQNKIRKKDGVITVLFYFFDFSCFRVGKVKKKSHYLLVIGAVGTAANLLCGSPHRRRVPGNPRRGFPTPKQSAGLFCLPSCAFLWQKISLRARSDQRFYLWKPPPLKRRAKFYFRADSLQKNFLFHPTGPFFISCGQGQPCPYGVRKTDRAGTKNMGGNYHRPYKFDFSFFRVRIVKKQSYCLREFAVRQPAPRIRCGRHRAYSVAASFFR